MNILNLNPGVERQVGASLEDIRDDHKERYIWAAERLNKSDDVIDAGCGVGYGSALLAARANSVYAIDISEDAIAYANKYWAKPNISHAVEDLSFFSIAKPQRFDAIVAFEVIEHLIEPRLFLMRAFEALKSGGRIFVSVPNENVIPHTVSLNPFHFKHYTIIEIRNLMLECGFDVKKVASQNIKEITEGDSGRFMILEAKRKAKCPVLANDLDRLKNALTQAANYVVARSVAIHKATKDIKTLKSRLEEANKTITSFEQKSESHLKLLQFFDGFRAQTHASQDLLVSDLLRRVKELESLERELREGRMHAELQRTKLEEELRFEQKSGQAQTELLKGISAELGQAKSEIDHYQSDILSLRNELMQSELLRLRAEDARQLAMQKSLDQHESMSQLSTDLVEATKKCQVLSNELVHAERERDAQSRIAAHDLQMLEVELVGWKNQFEKAIKEREDIATHLNKKIAQANAELSSAKIRFDTDRKSMQEQLDTLQKLASQAEDKRDSMSLRLLAVGQDSERIMAVNQELIHKLQAAETEVSRLEKSVSVTRSQLHMLNTTSAKGSPSLGYIYSKLRVHRFYLPFLYKAVRNSVRNQANRFSGKV